MLLIDSRVWLLGDNLFAFWGRNQGRGVCRDKGKERGKGTCQRSATDDSRKWGTGKICRYHHMPVTVVLLFMFQPAEAGFYYLYDGKEYHRMYVKAGDEIHFQGIDGDWKQVDITGEENRSLEQWKEIKRSLKMDTGQKLMGPIFPRFDSVRLEVDRWLQTTVIRDSLFSKSS